MSYSQYWSMQYPPIAAAHFKRSTSVGSPLAAVTPVLIIELTLHHSVL